MNFALKLAAILAAISVSVAALSYSFVTYRAYRVEQARMVEREVVRHARTEAAERERREWDECLAAGHPASDCTPQRRAGRWVLEQLEKK